MERQPTPGMERATRQYARMIGVGLHQKTRGYSGIWLQLPCVAVWIAPTWYWEHALAELQRREAANAWVVLLV